ncbi:hypothetical protein [Mitsuokella multacida]|uniref:hypothetical protein n=1 Tax=Mitsuokella multacida TaxID=52226 RepID=UPI003F5E80F2
MINGEKVLDHPIRWAMVGGGRGSQIGYIHRSAALRDRSFELVAGAFDIDPERGKDFGIQLGVAPERCYPDYKTMLAEEAKRSPEDRIEAVTIAPCRMAFIMRSARLCSKPVFMPSVKSRCASRRSRRKSSSISLTAKASSSV